MIIKISEGLIASSNWNNARVHATVRAVLTRPEQSPHIIPGLFERMDLLSYTAIVIDGDLRMIALDNIIKIPAFHFNDDDAEVRRNHNKIRMAVIDIGLVIDEIIIGKFF